MTITRMSLVVNRNPVLNIRDGVLHLKFEEILAFCWDLTKARSKIAVVDFWDLPVTLREPDYLARDVIDD